MSIRKCICKRCGAVFAADSRVAHNTKFCDACKPIADAERKREYAKKAAERRKNESVDPEERKHTLSDRIEKLRLEGVSYAEAQRKETIALYAHVDISGGGG